MDGSQEKGYIYIERNRGGYIWNFLKSTGFIVSEKTINVRSDFLAEKKFWKTSKNVFQLV